MQLRNEAAEKLILQEVVQNKDSKLLATINQDWLTGEHQNLLHILRLRKECMEYFYCSEYVAENNIDISSQLIEVVFKGKMVGNVSSAMTLVEEKYLARKMSTVAAQITEDLNRRVHPLAIVAGVQEDIAKIKYSGERIEKLGESLEPDTMDLIDFGKDGLESLYLSKQEIMILGGERGHQKTNYAIDLICGALDYNVNSLNNQEFKVMFFSREMSYKNLKARLLSRLFRITFGDIRKGNYNVQQIEKEFKERYWYYNDNFLLIKPEQINSVEDVAKFIMQEKPTVWVFDYMQLLARLLVEKGEDVNNKIAWLVTQFKALAQVTNTLGIVVSTLTKFEKGRISHVPRLEDLYSSVEIQYLATWIGLCYWPWFYHRHLNQSVFVTLWEKNRNEEPFMLPMQVEPQYSTFGNLKPHSVKLEDYLK